MDAVSPETVSYLRGGILYAPEADGDRGGPADGAPPARLRLLELRWGDVQEDWDEQLTPIESFSGFLDNLT